MCEVAVYTSLFSISGSNLGKKTVVKWDPCQYTEWNETHLIDTSYFITCKFAERPFFFIQKFLVGILI